MNRDHCLLERNGHVLIVTLNRPEAKNALTSGMLAGMYRCASPKPHPRRIIARHSWW
jgi:enoyl-CoA hydratase/carnithine racemase